MNGKELYETVKSEERKHGFDVVDDAGDYHPHLKSELVVLESQFHDEDGASGPLLRFTGRAKRMGPFETADLRRYADELNRLADLVDELNDQRFVYERRA